MIEVASTIVSNFLKEKVLEAFPVIGKGSVNAIFFVRTETRKVIVRINNLSYLDEYEKECWCIEQATLLKIPGPTVLACDEMAEVAFMLETFIDGSTGDNNLLDKRAIWQRLGQYARQIHTINLPPFGGSLNVFPPDKHISKNCSFKIHSVQRFNHYKSRVTNQSANLAHLQGQIYLQGSSSLKIPKIDNFAIKWPEYLGYNISSLTPEDELLKLKIITGEQSLKFKELFEGLKGREYKFGLIHRDLALRNVIVEPSGQMSLIDWGSAEINIIPHTDLVQLLESQILEADPGVDEIEAFIQGYGISRSAFKQMRPELETLLLLRTLDTLRWSIDCKPERTNILGEKAKKIIISLGY